MDQQEIPDYGMQIDPKLPLMAVMIMGIIMACLLSQMIQVPEGKAQEPIEPETTQPEPTKQVKNGFSAPYDSYTITQGLHGFSYGHMAIDLTAGKGAKIKSPIKGVVSENYIDGLGNTTLVIENDRYRVTLMHGDYSVSVGEQVKRGQTIGRESNHGYTTDLQGRSCAGRDCGYHTHLNVFDKEQNANINPLSLMNP